MKRLLLAILILCALPCFADERAQGFCMVGGQKSITQGLQSTNDIMASYPQCQVNVYFAGTTTPATLYSDNGVTPLTNPFTANTDASWGFYSADGHYDIVLSGGQAGGFPVPFTISNYFLNSGGSGSSVTIEVNGTVVPPSVYNFINGNNTTVSNPSGSDIEIDATGGGACGSNEIPCLNTPNTWTTGIQLFQSSGTNNIPVVVEGGGGGYTTPAYVQGSGTPGTGSPFFGCAVALNSVTAGDALIVFAQTSHDGTTPATATDAQGDTYTNISLVPSGSNPGLNILVAPNVVGGDTNVAVDGLAEVNKCSVVEYSGITSVTPLDAIQTGTTSSSASYTAGPVTTSNVNDLLITYISGAGSAQSATIPSGYAANTITDNPGSDWDFNVASVVVNSAGAYSASWTTLSSPDYDSGIIALKAGGTVFQNAPLLVFEDSTGTPTGGSVNSNGQYVLPSYSNGAGNTPNGPALAYNAATECPEFYDTTTNTWTGLCGGGTPGGSNGSIQVNNSDAFGAATSPQIVTALNTSPSSTFAPTLLPLATSSAFGAIKPDNVSCSVSAGILACTGSGGGITTLTGDVTASGSGSVATTLATVNSGPGSCGDATHVCQVTTNGKGLVTAQSAVAITGIGSVGFDSITSATNTTAAMVIGTGGSLGTSGTGSITATSMPYTGLTGSAPTWNQDTTGTAAGLSGSPAITVSNITDSALTAGQCVQATTAGLLVTTGLPCGSGSGGGISALTGDVNASGTGSVPAAVRGINGVIMSSLATGILKNASVTGVPSIATPGVDYLLPAGSGASLTNLNAAQLTAGTIPAARLPSPSASTLGGIQSITAVTHEWINSITTSGVPIQSQPQFSDIAGTVAAGQLPLATTSAFGAMKPDNVTITISGGVISSVGGGGISGLTPGRIQKAITSSTLGSSFIDETTTPNTDTFNGSNGIAVKGTGPTLITMGGGSVSFTPGSGVTSMTCTSGTCQTARGSFSIVGGTATTGTIATIVFPITTLSVPVCGVSVNGQATYLGIGHGAPTTTGFTITSAVSVAGKTVAGDWWCEG